MRKVKQVVSAAIVAGILHTPALAEGHVYKGCKKAHCMRHVIKPFRHTFLGPVGACESGTTRFLRHGLRAISPNGKYRGRYQFDMSSWHTAGGPGDPVNAGWVRQAYTAVVWLDMTSLFSSWPVCGHRALM
jgi:hypothetical protein